MAEPSWENPAPPQRPLGVLPPPGQIHAVQGCLAHLIKVLSFSTLQKCHSYAVLPHGTRFPPPRGTVPSWGSTMGRASCLGLQNWTVVLGPPIPAPRLLPKTLCPAQSPPKKSVAKTPRFGWKHGRDQADPGTFSSQGGQQGFELVTCPVGPPFGSEQGYMLYAIILGYILAGASSRPGQRQSQQGHRSWEKAQLLTDFIY